MSDLIPALVVRLAEQLLRRGLMLTAAESCTGGGVARVCTDLAGSSAWFERGFVTYTNIAKQEMLGVTEATLSAHGAVSEATVREMAEGALAHSHAQLSVAISGIAGPSGGSDEKPVGTVWFGWAGLGATRTHCVRFEGDRAAVREQAVAEGLRGLLEQLGE